MGSTREPTMSHEFTSKDRVRHLTDEFSSVIHSEPTVQIQLKNACTGQYRFDRINKECWRDEVVRRGCELFWAEDGFEVIEELSHGTQEGSGFSTTGFWIARIGSFFELNLVA
jgi:hypothetical protein